ncbi:DEAD/DEAH box helicase family protein [Mediterraneibacter gnavus]|uniref:DEAD/DEAH box helicase family protein n=1 Tax=Mediterraneibacter gnavus TaxID=33038 RepID=UPI003FF02A8C
MARKYDLISELYNRTCKTVVSSPKSWQDFLTSACRNYKLRFDEQLLVFAQRPDATAVLEIERWNGTFGRWVNKGATGIAVFDDVSRSRQRLIHYFDISDTHESRYSRPVPIWSMKPEYEEEIIETLESTFGAIEDKSSLASAIMCAARNATEDNIPDYVGDLLYTIDNSFLEDLNEDMIASLYRKTVTNSVAYMMMERLGIDTEEHFFREDFEDIVNFNTPETLNALGFATSDIAEMGLAEIAKTVMSLDKQNRIIVENQNSDYNIVKENQTERSLENDRTDLHDAGRLQTAQSDLTGAAGSTDGTLLPNEGEVPEGKPKGSVLQSPDELQVERASDGSGTDGDRADGTLDERASGERGRDGEPESNRYDELGSTDEQHSQSGSGNGVEASSLRLDYYDRSNEDKSLPFFGGDDTVREILGTTPHLKASKDEIRAFFENVADDDKRTEYIKSIFNNDYTEVILSDDRRVGYKTYQNVLHLWEGSYLSRTAQSFYDWRVITRHFEAMRLLGELQDKIKPLPSMDGQMSLMLDYEAEVTKPSAFSFSQEIIDAILCRGSSFSEGKFRIYEQFQKSLSKKENADFLKNEYGWGGSSPAITGTGISEMHDGKGIKISKKVNGKEEKVLLNWNQVEKRISELIKMDRYLNAKEKELYPEWLERQEIRRAEAAEERRKREILSTAPPEKKEVEAVEERYEYHLGSTVYLGANEYEIQSFDDERVMLYDLQFPLFNKEMTRAEFDQKVQENPMNDHLEVKVEKAITEPDAVIESETKTLYAVLSALKIDDVELDYDDNGLVATDSMDNEWHGQEFYKFLVEEAFVFEDNGGVLGISDEVLKDFTKLSEDNGVPVKDNRVKQPYRGYLEVKAEYPDTFVFYQVGDFFEAYNEDAQKAADIFDLFVTSRPIRDNERVPMFGIPKHALETYMTMLTDRGYDVAVASLENGERKVYNLVSQNKEDPVESKPIGRIDYLHTDGRVRESIEYTSPYQFEKDIKEENHYGVPMQVVLYADENGATVPHNFIYELDPPLHGTSVILNPYLNKPLAARLVDFYKDYDFYDYQDTLEVGDTDEDAIKRMDTELSNPEAVASLLAKLKEISQDADLSSEQKEELNFLIAELEKMKSPLDIAKEIIDEYCREEFERDEGADYTNLSEVNVAYTTTEDDKHEIQANVNLVDFKIETLVDGTVIRTEQYDSLEDLTEQGLKNLSFDDLVYLSEEELERVEKASAPVVPAWEKQKKSKVQSFDLHPEIPMSERHNFDLANNEIEEVNKKERFHRNYAAITVLKRCQEENRFATPDEQKILSRYVGWGGIPEAFDERAGAWHTEYAMLKNILTPEEYESARESTLTAFYTPPTVIKAVYKAMEQMGFREGNILEPSCGIGHFIGMMPDSMSESKIYGVELDTISAGIAQQLYQKTSIAAQGFEEANLPDSFFDAVVGNVPFGDFKVPDKRYDKHKFLIHDYFFAKSLDKLRPGGVMALITSKGTMDKENPAVRKYIAQRADLLGAIRLPNNTFKGNAGTEVVSDILILQKRDRLIDIEPDWVHLGTDENGIPMNSYFVDHPEMILGEMQMVSGRFGPEPSCVPYEGADLAEQLNEAIANIHGEVTAYEVDDELTEEDNSIPADPTVRNFSYTVVDDKIYFRENSRMAPVDVSATAESRIKGMITIRDAVRNLIELQTEDYPDYEIKAEQERLNTLYDTFTSKYGLLNSRANTSAFSQDSSYSLLSALEILDDEGNLERKADMFFKRTIKPHTPVTSVDTSSEALAVSMGEKAYVDMEYMCQLSGKTEEEIYSDLKGVIFLNPMYGYGNSTEAKYLMADEYLSGNVREKLAWAKRSAELNPDDYKIHVEALEKVQPKDLTASEISVRLGATWLPPEIVEQFIFEFLGTPRYAQWNIKLHFSQYTGEWNLEGKSYDRGNVKAYNTYGTSRINAYKIIEETLNLKDVRIFDYIEEPDGKKKAVLNKKETAIAQSKQELIKQGFQDWIWADPERRERLCKLYNEKFNSIRPREYDGSHITFNGMNPEIELREHQKNAVAHILYGGNTLLAHAVGAGKTFEMTAAAMESKRLGLCNKSLFVVPNHLTEQWAAEFLQLYPSANVLVATKKDFETKNRKRFCGRIATGDYDAIIIGHSQFEKIPMSIERQRAILEEQLSEITNGIADLKRNRGDNFSVKQLERTKKSVKQKLDKLNDQTRKDDVVTFEELGVDRLFIDESHYYKNLFLYTKMRNVGGIAQTEAMKSSDLFMKCRYLDEITGGRGTVFATGTPISNSMVELYTIQRYLQYNTLVKNNLQHFDAWASTFGETITAVELTPEGSGYRAKTRFARFYNLPELMAMFKEVADIKTADMLDLPVPKAIFHNISVKPSEHQKQMVAELAERAEKVRNGMVDASVDNMLKITNDGRKLALDQRLINPLLPDFEGSKLNACVDAMFEKWEKGKEKRLTQLFFCDLSTPKNDGNFSVYDDIRKKLIERGVPAEEIKFIHEADTEAKKLELFKKVRRGDVRILMGSTQKMGAGTNVQNKLSASSDLDCPWRPSDLEQRLGRSIRQGNENPEVDIYRFVTEETFDAYLYQLVEGKQKFASQIMTSKSPVRSCEDIDETALSYAEIKMLATGNPHIKEKMDLDIQVQKLRLLKSNFLSERYALEDKIIKFYPQDIARRTETIKSLKADIERVAEHPKPSDDTFVGMTVKGVFYSEKADAGNAILDACQAMTSPDPIPLGEYRGFQMELYFETFTKEYKVKLKGELGYPVTLGTDTFGNITRFDNALEGLPKRLEINEQELENTKKQFETAKVDVCKPFNQEEELQTKTARLNELNALLNVDKRENEIVGGEPDEGDEAPTPKNKDRER